MKAALLAAAVLAGLAARSGHAQGFGLADWFTSLFKTDAADLPKELAKEPEKYFTEAYVRLAKEVLIVPWEEAGSLLYDVLNKISFSEVTTEERRQICAKTGGLLLTTVSVSSCEIWTQTVAPVGLEAQTQTCLSGKGYDKYTNVCVYVDPEGKYFWDDGPSIPPAADRLLALTGLTRTRYATLFWVAGQLHDYCYHHHGTYGYSRAACDIEFGVHMDKICAQKFKLPWFVPNTCRQAAAAMALAVIQGGQSAYDATNTLVNYMRIAAVPGSRTPRTIGGPGAEFVMDAKRRCVYGLSPDRSGVFERCGTFGAWKQIGGPAEHLYGGDTLYASGPGNSSINRYEGTPWSWRGIGGPGAEWAVSMTGEVYGLSPDKSEIDQYDAAQDVWFRIGDAADHLYAGTGVLFASSPGHESIAKYEGIPFQWTQIGGPGANWAVVESTLYGLTPTRDAVFRHESGASWTQVGGPASAIFGGSSLLALTPGRLQIMQLDPSSAKWIHIGGPVSFATSQGNTIIAVSAWNRDVVEFVPPGGG